MGTLRSKIHIISLLLVGVNFFQRCYSTLQNVPGKVGAGNYTYFQLNFQGALLLELETSEGDADLYVSEKLQRPTFELDEHSLSSWTCGRDAVFIPKTMARPIYIGVYGHPRYEQSVYMMSAEVLPENVDEVDAFMNIKEDERQKASFKYKTDDNVENSEAPEVLIFYYQDDKTFLEVFWVISQFFL